MDWLETEKLHIEYKKSEKTLPKDLWRTVSAFANTDGGVIYLGVKDNGDCTYDIQGIDNADMQIVDLFNLSRNREKINVDIISENCVEKQLIDGKTIVKIIVNAVSYNQRPIYLNQDIRNTYIRKHDGDSKASEEEIKSFLRNASAESDNVLLNDFTIQDLDPDSIMNFRMIVANRNPQVDYSGLSNQDFLNRVGVFGLDKFANAKLKLGGLLFLGKSESILRRFPYFHLDYFNKKGEVERWRDRVATDDITIANLNVFKFYQIVLDKLRNTIDDSFELDNNMVRKSHGDIEIALQEALANMLIHADYEDTRWYSIVEAHDAYYTFENAGMMRISEQEFYKGGYSVPRNTVLIQLFRHAGVSDHAGMGGPKIYDLSRRNKYRFPQLETDIRKTKLTIWTAELKNSFPELSEGARDVLQIFFEGDGNKLCSLPEICTKLGKTKYALRSFIEELLEKNFLTKSGSGRYTRYRRKISSLEALDAMQQLCKHAEHLMSMKHI